MNISGIIISVLPEKIDSVVSGLADNKHLELYLVSKEQGKIIAVMEEKSINEEVGRFKDIHNLPGVVSVSMAYHYFEEEASIL